MTTRASSVKSGWAVCQSRVKGTFFADRHTREVDQLFICLLAVVE
ncbi:predicted protein [Plenodomus lingam JN3]|uniref:Predicted protein n=1 Tax=Leptosphaeria maculans (strain JN3 / isolate v23.1.3 / race Av1-4-5-6-7-8) TaxID=985895 RepID=E4ZMM5_LEPMJ|nr:predicted protein [Plenodomus lingam JN3]CBX92894.1 predicted protein [Plenodomus lingam JN3]